MLENAIVPPIALGIIQSPRTQAEIGILALDGSGSMEEPASGNITKAQAVNHASRGFFGRFKASRYARDFDFGVVTFDNKAEVRLQITPVTEIDDNDDYNPLISHGGGTCIHEALLAASKLARDYVASQPVGGVVPHTTILLLSDGCCQDPKLTIETAKKIKSGEGSQKATICCALFATVGQTDASGEALLREIASDPVMGFKAVYDAESLRNFFVLSQSTSSGCIVR